jgi:pimeloyl-ACP methyl ester carboxylesterase
MGGHLDCYRLVPVKNTRKRWLNTVPESSRDGLIPDGWFDAWAAATLSEDPWSTGKAPDRLRATNGPIQDIRNYWAAGKPFYNPSDIDVPVLLVHGEWDYDVPIDLALAYFGELRSAPYRRWVEIGEATHMLLLEKNRLQAFKTICDFYDEAFTPAV